VECGCGAKFTAGKSWYRHVRNTCPNRCGDAAVSATPAKKPPTADRPESLTATAPVGGPSEDHISPREIGLEEWSQWIIDNRHCDYDGIGKFLDDAINDIPGPLRDAMTGWLKTAITAAVNVGR
jgi:hypothetical protein